MLALLRSLLILELIGPDLSVSFLISNLFFAKLLVSYSFCVGLYIFSETIASECPTFHMAPHLYGFLYARGYGGAMDRETV